MEAREKRATYKRREKTCEILGVKTSSFEQQMNARECICFRIGFCGRRHCCPGNDGMLYNGITVFDLGPGSRSGDAAAAEKGPEMVLYNGITYFDQGNTKSEAKGSAAGGVQPDGSVFKPYNGITVF